MRNENRMIARGVEVSRKGLLAAGDAGWLALSRLAALVWISHERPVNRAANPESRK
jgi:hypothetical protein